MTIARPRVEISTDASVRSAALALRAQVFRAGRSDEDGFDAEATHGVFRDGAGEVLACFRLKSYPSDRAAQSGYTGQFYDLSKMDEAGPVVELGRLAVAPGVDDPDVLRRIFAGIADWTVSANAVALIGCTSFAGTDPYAHACAFAWLARGHLLPDHMSPKPVGPKAWPVDTATVRSARPDPSGLPPLLRIYLSLGGKIGRHAVVDPELQTIHVYTRLETSSVSDARRRVFLGRS